MAGGLQLPWRRDLTVVGVWDVVLGRPIVMLRGSAGPVTAVAYGPDGNTLAAAAAQGPERSPIVTLWHLPSRRVIRTFDAGRGPVVSLALSGDGRRLAAGTGPMEGPGRATAWDVETGTVLGAQDHVAGWLTSIAFHPDGARIAVAGSSEQGTVHLWDLAAGTFVSHPGPSGVGCVVFTPDGKRLAALGFDGDVHLRDAQTGNQVLVLRSFGPPIGGGGFTPRLAFSPDGSRIAGYFPGLVNLWDLGASAGLAVEPKAGDVAGWLRRSRALADQGDPPGAMVARARAH